MLCRFTFLVLVLAGSQATSFKRAQRQGPSTVRFDVNSETAVVPSLLSSGPVSARPGSTSYHSRQASLPCSSLRTKSAPSAKPAASYVIFPQRKAGTFCLQSNMCPCVRNKPENVFGLFFGYTCMCFGQCQ
ncbi:hypothetical protein HJG60_009928 [Phyllostomus discolor]|uniref:Secreted protein n=1 Tax=Phyllostomus discolor TaxID=89673 RepID=A0A834ET73_9CHIR|nr:hypothetical protein HJG60_009928 [Phyllostomus discolor]